MKLRLVLLFHRPRLVQRRLERARIDLEQGIPGLDLLPLLEQHLCDLAVHPALYRDGVERLNGPEPFQIHRHAAGFGAGRRHRHALRCGRGLVRRRRPPVSGIPDQHAREPEQDDQHRDQRPPAAAW